VTESAARRVFTVTPIGVVRSPFADKASAPRQASIAKETRGRIELEPGRGFEHAIEGLAAWDHLWVVYWFHQAEGSSRNKVQPPRSAERRGVLATRSPHRPNPLGLSAVRLLGVEGLTLHVEGIDMIDGTPVLDIKPYVAYADSIPDASAGWLDDAVDPGPRYQIDWDEPARAQVAWLASRGHDVVLRVETILRAGPEPHPYRRIKRGDDGALTLAVKAWRFRFSVDGARVSIHGVETGYRPRELARASDDPELALHRDYVAAFGGSR
jgi:tRNA-Thr(GGU) m(6)t(6)A37 methyltransferase TsaA